jgi:hypothetical protein
MKSTKFMSMISLWIACACLLALCATAAAQPAEPKDLPLLQKWSGDYPVVQLNRLPEGQQKSRVGFIGDEATFGSVWQALKPGEKVPAVDFGKEIVVFSRNVVFYNRTSIAKVTLYDGVAEVIAIETVSSLPIEDKVAMALAVIPRAGVKFIQTGDERVPVTKKESATDPLNAYYTIEGRQVHLVAGRAEVEVVPGSATKIKTSVFGKPVYGDLDGDGKEDAALLLVHDPGGSGTFYYVAAALDNGSGWQGTRAMLLGDRIVLRSIQIHNGVIIVNYLGHLPDEPLSAPATVDMRRTLTVEDHQMRTLFDKGEGTK